MEKGAVIINDVATGEIRALVSLPDFLRSPLPTFSTMRTPR